MVPQEYRIDVVAGRLASTLDGIRRGHGTAERRREVLRVRAERHVTQVVSNWRVIARELDLGVDPEAHVELMQEAILANFLPRFQQAVDRMEAQEARGYGLRALTSPWGRVLLGVMALIMVYALFRGYRGPWVLPVGILLLGMPMLPELARWGALRQYRSEVEEVLADLGRIQEESDSASSLLSLFDLHDDGR